MRPANFLRILMITAALSGYSAWVIAQRPSREKSSAEVEVAGIRVLPLETVESLWHDSSTVFLDVRSAMDFDFGHIAGAISVPEEEFDKRFAELKPRLEQAKTIIVYCDNRKCAKSLRTTIRLHQEGLTQTAIYPAGWNEWYLHDLPIARSEK
jgi:rhodanese-related sulfurtransferase